VCNTFLPVSYFSRTTVTFLFYLSRTILPSHHISPSTLLMSPSHQVEKALAEKAAGKKFNWALARLCSDFLARLRTKKATLVKHRSVMIIQRVFRGSIARNLNKRLKEQSSLVRNWLTDFKHERVPGLIDSKEVRLGEGP